VTQPVIFAHNEVIDCAQTKPSLKQIWEFLGRQRTNPTTGLVAVSLFSGGGIGDIGYEQAGFKIILQAELDADRVALCASNFPDSRLVSGNIIYTRDRIVEDLSKEGSHRIDMSVTKNCGTLLRESELRRLDGVKRASDDNLPQILVTLN